MEEKKYMLLVINPGSTSTKIGVFENEREIFRRNIEHSSQELAAYAHALAQYELRKRAVVKSLEENGIKVEELAAVMARGGPLPSVTGGAYYVNERMLKLLESGKVPEHAANVAALIAHEIAEGVGIPAMIYDAIGTDEMEDIARISGMPAIARPSLCHTLNSKAIARKVAAKLHKTYQDITAIVAHLGGGITVSIHKNGRIVDLNTDDEGPFSPERAGRVPCRILIDLCYSGRYDYQTMRKMLRGKGGLVAYLGTNNAVEVEARINNGDAEAELIYQAMAYQVAKAIGELATVVNGKVDRIALTGGLAHSQMLTGWIRERVSFLAPVEVFPGENELESLAAGGLRVLRGEEQAKEYK